MRTRFRFIPEKMQRGLLMNRRDFVSQSVRALVASSLPADTKLLTAQSENPKPGKSSPAPVLWSLSNNNIRVRLAGNGTIRNLEVMRGDEWEKVAFRTGVLSGPAWAGITMARVEGTPASFAGTVQGIRYSIDYRIENDSLVIAAGIENQRTSEYAPQAARLILGIDCEMRNYPAWDFRYFPTLLRCEKTHFWGYLMTPMGRILAIGLPDPIASYTINYDEAIWSPGDGGDLATPCMPRKDAEWSCDGGHLIFTCSLDLLHTLPLPARHPQNLVSLQPGEQRRWTIYLQPLATMDDIKPALASTISAPMIEADRYTIAPDESSHISIWAPQPVSVSVFAPDGSVSSLATHPESRGRSAATFTPAGGPGLYRLAIAQRDGKVSEASISVRHNWSWYMIQARKESLVHKQYASSHLEQWLGLETDALARLFVPDPELDAQTDKRLKEILHLQWDLTTKTPSNIPIKARYLVNTAQMAGVLAYRYMADHDPYWLDLASGFADYVVSLQWPDGNYDNYTSVAYPVKSVMTVMAAEKIASATDARYRAAYQRHYLSAKKAMDFLVRSQDNLTTEGQNTFEDGMISCSGTQLAMFALLQTDPEERRRYAEASRTMLFSHRCLEQLLIPDSRMNGATLRFWEAQYDVLIAKARNMMDSPHGWSAWLIPGLWFQYLLTGQEDWLRKAMNAMGSCAQLIDFETGKLRWAFVPDPYREVTMLVPNPDNPMRGLRVNRTIGEQYIPMIASFHYPDHEPIRGNGMTSGWSCCNDVHEVFTSLAEVALTAAYVIEREDGQLVTWNCRATCDSDATVVIQGFEDVISRIHLNLRSPRQVSASFARGHEVHVKAAGMQWIGPGGIPEILRT